MLLTCRHVLPVDRPPIERGAVLVRDGRIVSVGPLDEFGRPPDIDYGDAVMLPGLINAHTHLELTYLRGMLPPSSDFVDWLRRMLRHQADAPATAETVDAAVTDGVKQSLRAGVTTVGDITRSPDWSRPVLALHALRAVSFGEVIAIGTRRGMLDDRLAAATSLTFATPRLIVGLSPHAPYTVEPEGLRACARRAIELRAAGERLPVCIHLSETPQESEFTRSRTGPIADYLAELGILDDRVPRSECSPAELVDRAGLLGPHTVLAHANYVSADDIHLMAERGSSVAYCPRTHAAFRHAPHPFRAARRAGINVAVGTDSLASNPSLSVIDELRFIHQSCHNVALDDLLGMGTMNGARALGLHDEVGSLTPGKWADLAVFPLEQATSKDGWADVLRSTREPIAVYVAGDQVV